MKERFAGALARLTIFTVVCALGLIALFAVFAQVRVDSQNTYRAEFNDISGLKKGDFVRIAGVEVGKVGDISFKPDASLVVEFTADQSTVLTDGTKAVVRYNDMVGNRYLELEEGAGGVKRILPGGTIPASRTAPALNLDALIGGFRPLFRALDPDQINTLSGQMIRTFQGQGGAISSLLSQLGALTNSLADRDDVIGQVIVNLNTVLGSLGDQSKQLDNAVDSVSELVKALAERKVDVTNAVAYGNAAAGSISDLLVQSRPALQNLIRQTDRTSGTVMADHDNFDNLLNTLPDAYRVIGRQGIYGDFFSFYMCDLMLKVNGKGGQPVYIKVAGQATGRCSPK